MDIETLCEIAEALHIQPGQLLYTPPENPVLRLLSADLLSSGTRPACFPIFTTEEPDVSSVLPWKFCRTPGKTSAVS